MSTEYSGVYSYIPVYDREIEYEQSSRLLLSDQSLLLLLDRRKSGARSIIYLSVHRDTHTHTHVVYGVYKNDHRRRRREQRVGLCVCGAAAFLRDPWKH